MNKSRFVLAAMMLALFSSQTCLLAASRPNPLDPHVNEIKAQRDARMAWWRKAKFGMFIHWGLYSHYAGSFDGTPTSGLGEWMMHDEKVPVAPYAAGASQFDPEGFNADTWVSIAKAAGMKYIVMTAKHHEGFAMFHTSVDKFNIYDDTPFKRDPIAEMAVACKKAGIKFGVYYSQNLDWHHPGGSTAGPAWDPAQSGDFDTYIKTVSAPQVSELIEHIHPAVLWFDIPGKLTPDEVQALTASFKDDPELIYNNRMGGGIPGDTETPEQHIPATGYKDRDWETCMTINGTWGFKAQDTNFKSTATLLQNLVDIASKGGNYLLNVGPDGDGIIPQPEVDRLKTIGAWLSANGESIYGTTASPLAGLPSNERMTVKGDTYFLHVFEWNGNATLPGLNTEVASAKTLVGGQELAITKDADGVTNIAKPTHLDKLDTVIKLKLAGPLDVTEIVNSLKPAADGTFTGSPKDATTTGAIQVEGTAPDYDLGYWLNGTDTVSWYLAVPDAGDYTVKINYSCDDSVAGSTFNVTGSEGSKVSGTVGKTGGWKSYQELVLPGTLHLDKGTQWVTIAATRKPGYAVMNLRAIVLKKVD